jgi:hypothetical protein
MDKQHALLSLFLLFGVAVAQVLAQPAGAVPVYSVNETSLVTLTYLGLLHEATCNKALACFL